MANAEGIANAAMPNAAMLVIGDEILSGRTRDSNLYHLAQALTAAGIDLAEVRIVPDEQSAIVSALNALRAAYTHVFTSGGIGPTHDDITADAVALAFGVAIDVRVDARAILAERYARQGSALNEARLRMARIPDGATLIDNPVSGAPGFTLGNVHVMAGVPSVFEAMVASVLPSLTGGRVLISRSVRIERGEGDIAGTLAKIAASYPELKIGSYPFNQNGKFGANIVFRGAEAPPLDAAIAELCRAFPEAQP